MDRIEFVPDYYSSLQWRKASKLDVDPGWTCHLSFLGVDFYLADLVFSKVKMSTRRIALDKFSSGFNGI